MHKSSRMKYFLKPLKKTVLSMTALILVLGGSACGPAPAAAPVIQTVVSPKVVTVPVTQDVTQVVTRVVDVPVTVTLDRASDTVKTGITANLENGGTIRRYQK